VTLPRRLSRHLEFDGQRVRRIRHPKTGVIPPGYQGIIAMATAEASTFTTLVNLTNQGLYFNQISCVDQNNCWATCEGQNVTTGATYAWIYNTNNGWKNWTTQLYFEGGSLTSIMMLNANFGIAGGAYLGDSPIAAAPKGTFFQTTDGQTWTPMNQLNDFYAMDISVVDQNTAFSSGLTELGLSSFARYSTAS